MKKKKNLVVFIGIAFLVGIFIGMDYVPSQKEVVEIPDYEQVIVNKRSVTMKLPAVNTNGSGVSATLTVKVIPGNGLILFNINNVLAREDTQQSARVAALVASDYTKKSIKSIDIIYSINANASLLEGPSGGTAFAIATIAALENKELNDKVMISGSLNHDGSIGVTGRVIEKAKVAKEEGANLFLVPLGTSIEIDYIEEEHCQKWGSREYCEIEIIPEKTDISKEVGIEVKEVENIEEAADYFFE